MIKFYLFLLLLSFSICFKAQVTMLTNMPKSIAPNANIVLEIKINKGGISNFAKYQLDVPAGITITEGDSKTGNFTFENNRAKIVWVSIPAEAEYICTMKLNSGNASGILVFNQKFYFLDNGTKKEVEGEPLNVTFDANGSTVAASLPVETNNQTTTKSETPVANNNTETNNNTTTATKTETKAATTEIAPETKIVVTKNETKPEPKTEAKTTTTSNNGLVYKIQLGAYGADPGNAKFAVIGKVTINNEGGFYKALYGNFNSKDEALKKREELISKGFNGFVVSYQNGVRVK